MVRGEQVSRVRFAVQQLIFSALGDLPSQVAQRVGEQFPVRFGEFRAALAVDQDLQRFVDALREVGCGDPEVAHAVV